MYLVSADGSGVARSQFDVARRRPILWLPLRGQSPSGVLLSLGDDDRSIVADEVSESGVKPIGSFPTIFPGSGMLPYVTAAERLPDSRIVLLSSEEPVGGPLKFTLRLFADGGVIETTLPCAGGVDHSLTTAVDADGTIAAVGLSVAGDVVAMLIDPDHAERSACRVISASGESAAKTDRGSPTVAAGDREWFAGWTRSDGRVRLCKFASLDAPPVVVDAGEGVTSGAAGTVVNVHHDETLTVAWRTDRGIATRRMPQALAGFALLADLDRLRCNLLKRVFQ